MSKRPNDGDEGPVYLSFEHRCLTNLYNCVLLCQKQNYHHQLNQPWCPLLQPRAHMEQCIRLENDIQKSFVSKSITVGVLIFVVICYHMQMNS
jgi:hypothetical protein